jgi:hypothetical protein
MFVEGGLCVVKCSTGRIADNNGVCQLCSTSGVLSYFGECVTNCPSGYYNNSNNCETCQSIPNLVLPNGTCGLSCPAAYEANSLGVCVECIALGKVNNGGICSLSCNANMLPDFNNTCDTCQNLGLHYYETSCIISCPDFYYYFYNIALNQDHCLPLGTNVNSGGTAVANCPVGFKPDSKSICQPCKNLGFYQDINTNICYLECPSNLYQQDFTKNCINLALNNLELYNGNLVTNCPPGYSFNASDRICRTCYDLNLYLRPDGSCQTTCLVNHYTNNFNKTCVDYLSQGKVKLINAIGEQSIADNCPYGQGPFGAYNICASCFSNGKYTNFNTGLCVAGCAANEHNNTVTKICTNYLAIGKYLVKATNLLVDACPTNMAPNSLNICVTCVTLNLYNNYGKCESDCPIYTFKNTVTMTCINFLQDGFYLYNNLLYPACPLNTISNSANVCITCFDAALYNYLGACVNLPCPPATYTDIVNKICVDYIPLGLYIYENTLVSECPLGFSNHSNILNLCESCASQDIFSYQGKCTLACPPSLTMYVTATKKCIDYKIEGLYILNGILYESCPPQKWPDNLNACQDCFDVDVFKYNNICYSTCPKDTFAIELTKTCITCPYGTFFYVDKCLDSCPDKYYPSNGSCVFCNNYKYVNVCIETCPPKSFIDEIKKECFLCLDLGKIYHNGECIDKCPKFYYPDLINNQCILQTECTPNPCLNEGNCISLKPKTTEDFDTLSLDENIFLESLKFYECKCQPDFYGSNCVNRGLLAIIEDINIKLDYMINKSGFSNTLGFDDTLLIKQIIDKLIIIPEAMSDELTDKIYKFVSK